MIEKEMVKVSVIIPVYNTEKYVGKAIESIVRQTLKEIEIIVINDGSTDQSLQVMEEQAATDPRIQVLSQVNRGQSLTRNTGIDRASGKYLYFMDSDDLLEEDALELCYRKCEDNQLDFAFFDAESFYDDQLESTLQLKYKRTDVLDESTVYTGEEALRIQLQKNVFTASPCLSLIRKDFLNRHALRFYPGILHEDQLFTFTLYSLATRTACIRRTFFQRRIRKDSIMTRRFSERNLKGYLTVTREVLAFGKRNAAPQMQANINLYLSQMLNAVVWEAHVLPLSARLRLAAACLFKHKKYVSNRNIGVLLSKSLLHTQK